MADPTFAPAHSSEQPNSSHVKVTNVKVARTAGQASTFEITFDLAWRESWRDPPDLWRRNWDAAWVFVKYGTSESRELTLRIKDCKDVIEQLDRGDYHVLSKLWLDTFHNSDDKDEWISGDPVLQSQIPGQHWTLWHDRVVEGPNGDERIRESMGVWWNPSDETLSLERQGPTGHARITAVLAGPRNAQIDLPEDGLGVFVYRRDVCPVPGPVHFSGITLRTELTPDVRPTGMQVTVHGIEMVFIPQAPFSLGDPLGSGGPNNCFFNPNAAGNDRTLRIKSEEAIEVTAQAGDGARVFYLTQQTPYNSGDQKGPIPAEYPKGYRAFYIMKRSITQGQYTMFVNTLTGGALTSRFSYWFGDYRYQITKNDTGARFALKPSRACNWLSWMDGASYAAWSALRPMTELEYEKACRGPGRPLAGEYSWGTTKLRRTQVIFSDQEGLEAVDGNCNINNTQYAFVGGDGGSGPLCEDAFGRAPQFDQSPGSGFGMVFGLTPIPQAPPPTSDLGPPPSGDQDDPANPAQWITDEPPEVREISGRSYYRVQSLTGNVWEFVVSVGYPEGRAFTGKHGTGVLDKLGNPPTEELGWPGGEVRGVGGRGGAWYTPATHGRVADRVMAAGLAFYSGRSHDTGFRCVRTAPTAEELARTGAASTAAQKQHAAGAPRPSRA